MCIGDLSNDSFELETVHCASSRIKPVSCPVLDHKSKLNKSIASENLFLDLLSTNSYILFIIHISDKRNL